MPRQVDHAERRKHIVEALWALTAREGLTAVSFRKIASEADVSVRRIQYYFGNKATLLQEALQMLGERVVAAGLEAVEEAGPEPTTQQLLRAIITAALPTDDPTRSTSLLFFSFHVAAITDPNLASTQARSAKDWTVPFAAELIRQAQDQQGTHTGIDPEHEALMLMSAFAGLSLDILSGNRTDNEALAAVDYQLGRIFNGTPTIPTIPNMATDPSTLATTTNHPN